jgi:hypothetical protein
MERDRFLAELHEYLGYRPLNRTWAKLEILLGLLAVGIGLLLGHTAWTGSDILWGVAGAALALFVLGGHLTLAGHRSHLYQSSNEQLAYLAGLIHQLTNKDRHI